MCYEGYIYAHTSLAVVPLFYLQRKLVLCVSKLQFKKKNPQKSDRYIGTSNPLDETVRRKPYRSINKTLMVPYHKIFTNPTIHSIAYLFLFLNAVMTTIWRGNSSMCFISLNHHLSQWENKKALVYIMHIIK